MLTTTMATRTPHPATMRTTTKTIILVALLCVAVANSQGYQPSDLGMDRPNAMPSITNLEVMCGKDHMSVHLSFDKPFNGLVSSKGQYGSPECSYVSPNSGGMHYEYQIHYDRCGTKPDNRGKFYENTVIIQYDADLIEVWDEAKRLRCEWYNDYEKTASKPPMVIADLDVVALNFRGDNVDCWMEIQDGKGPWAAPVTGIVPLGSTLTMVIAINDHQGEFDMRTKSCEASDGHGTPIYLTDEHGCVLRPKMLSSFAKLRSSDGRSTVLTYAHFHAFKFPDSMDVRLKCKVEICRYGCPDHCQRPVAGNPIEDYGNNEIDRSYRETEGRTRYSAEDKLELLRNSAALGGSKAGFRDFSGKQLKEDSVPLGPRSLGRKKREIEVETVYRRDRRAVDDVGVRTDFRVISEADLEFTPARGNGAPVTVFQGQQIVYGVCLPLASMSALFVLLSVCCVVSVLVTGFMCHHRQRQKEHIDAPVMAIPLESSSNINVLNFLRNQLMANSFSANSA